MNNQKGFVLIVIILIIVIIFVGGILTWQYLEGIKEGEKTPQTEETSDKENYCGKDMDCACGVNIKTGNCFYGNKEYVDTTKQCPDFCTGITGKLVIKCINNQCVQKSEEVAEETTNWKIYRNDKYGFEFKYPPIPSGCERCKIDEETDEHFWINRTELIIMDSGELTLSEFVDKEMKEFTIEKRDNILIGGREGISVDYRFGGMNRFGSAAFVEKNGKVFVIQFTAGGFCCDPNVDRIYEMEVYDAILSTFKFLE